MLPKQFRLKKRKEFAYIYRKGNKVHSEHLTLTYIQSKLENPKIGVVVSNKAGNAVLRNRYKRQIREIMKQNLNNLRSHQNIVLSAHPNISECDFSKLGEEINFLLKKGNRINEQSD